LDAGRQARADLGDPLLDALDDGAGVGAVAGDDDRADDLALAVELGEAAADVRAEADPGDVGDRDRGAEIGAGLEDRLVEAAQVLQVAAAADEGLAAAELEDPAGRLAGALAHGVGDVGDGEAVGAQALEVELDLELALVAADAGDLGDALHALERVAEL